jgi:hypothetical protein
MMTTLLCVTRYLYADSGGYRFKRSYTVELVYKLANYNFVMAMQTVDWGSIIPVVVKENYELYNTLLYPQSLRGQN